MTNQVASLPRAAPSLTWPARRSRLRGALRLAGATALVLTVGASVGLIVLKVADDQYLASIQQDLERTPSTGQVFAPEMVANLPEPARRYFVHAIQPGTPLAAQVHLRQTGTLRVGTDWIAFSADQVLTPDGLVWRATSRLGPLPITATDHVAGGHGRTRIAALGLVPFVNESGPDISRSTIGRLIVEYMWLPPASLPVLRPGVKVEPVDADHFAVTVMVAGERMRLVYAVDSDGRLIESTLPRFGNQTPDQHYEYIPFGGLMDAEETFGGYTIPTRIRMGWWYGTAQYAEEFRFQVTAATFK